MGITVQEALRIPPLNKAKVLAGAQGLNRIISTVAVTDVPDFADWIKGNELIFTTGYFINPSLNLSDLIKMADLKGAAGIAIKLKRFIKEINEEVIALADDLDFPILSLPYEYRWVDYINQVGLAIMDRNTAEMGYSKKMLEDFTQVVLDGGGFDSIVQTAGATLNRPCALFDKQGNLISHSGVDLEILEVMSNNYRSGLKCNEFYDGIYSCPLKISGHEYLQLGCEIKTGNENFGYFLVLSQQDLSSYDRIILRQVLTVSCIEFQKRKAVETVEQNYKESFLHDLLLGLLQDYNIIKSKLKFYGLKIRNGGTVVLIDFTKKTKMFATKNRFISKIRDLLDTKLTYNQGIHTYLADQIVMIIPADKDIEKIVDNVKDIMDKNLEPDEYKIVIGRQVSEVTELCQSYQDARKILQLASICDENILDYKKLGLLRLLLSEVDQEVLKEFSLEYLRPILEYQQKNNTSNLLETLTMYYKENCNIRDTGRKLFIHYNTVRYRLNLVREILKLDIDHPDVKTTLSIALKLKTMMD